MLALSELRDSAEPRCVLAALVLVLGVASLVNLHELSHLWLVASWDFAVDRVRGVVHCRLRVV